MTTLSNLEVSSSDAVPTIDQDVVTDAKGRRLKLKRPDSLWGSRLTRSVGSDGAMNLAYMEGYVFPAASVIEIDGDPVMFPTTFMQLEALIQRLGDEGIMASLNWRMAAMKAAAEAQEGGEQTLDKAQIKN